MTAGELSQTLSSAIGSTVNTTQAIDESDTTSETTSNEAGVDTVTEQNAGTNTLATTNTPASDYTGTLTEDLGAGGTVAHGFECDSLSESSGATSTETDDGSATVTDSALVVTRTLSTTGTESDTDNESDLDWACETLGQSAAIAGGSDCFTVNDLATTGYTSTGTGPENYNDTASGVNGTANVSGTGSSSQLTHQVFGDILGSGGVIASGTSP